ncbi:MAG: GNAT family N-acetyltransferase [Pseudomonadota bacterium]
MEQRLPVTLIRALPIEEAARAYTLLKTLRPHLDETLFAARLAAQRALGYELYVAEENGRIVGVAGGRPVCNFSRGPHFFLDDLIVADTERGRHIGVSLLAHCERSAAARGMGEVVLNARPTAKTFYARNDYAEVPSPMMRKAI